MKFQNFTFSVESLWQIPCVSWQLSEKLTAPMHPDDCEILLYQLTVTFCKRCQWTVIYVWVALFGIWYFDIVFNLYVNSILLCCWLSSVNYIYSPSFPPLLYLYSFQYNSLILSIKRKHPLLQSQNLNGLVTCFDRIIF